MSDPAVLLLAGEASGDTYGGALAEELRRRRPDLRLLGTGGAAMRDAGVELLADLDRLAVMGFTEVLGRLGFFRRLERRIDGLLADGGIRLVVPIDYPGLNLRVARRARRRGVAVLYYVSPKVWAWRRRRVRALARDTNAVACILPFESEYLGGYGVRASFVGHPLLDREDSVEDDGTFRSRWRLEAGRPILALLPGSRRQEIAHHLECFVGAARRVQSERSEILPVVGRTRALPEELFFRCPFPVVRDVRGLLRHARAALLKSGTVTLEAALEGTPGVVAYRTGALTWAVASRLLRVEHVALPNLLLAERVYPELLQREATPERLAGALLPLVDLEDAVRGRQIAGLARVRERLGAPGVAARVADLAVGLLEGSS